MQVKYEYSSLDDLLDNFLSDHSKITLQSRRDCFLKILNDLWNAKEPNKCDYNSLNTC